MEGVVVDDEHAYRVFALRPSAASGVGHAIGRLAAIGVPLPGVGVDDNLAPELLRSVSQRDETDAGPEPIGDALAVVPNLQLQSVTATGTTCLPSGRSEPRDVNYTVTVPTIRVTKMCAISSSWLSEHVRSGFRPNTAVAKNVPVPLPLADP